LGAAQRCPQYGLANRSTAPLNSVAAPATARWR
jgi:hypothetical protein